MFYIIIFFLNGSVMLTIIVETSNLLLNKENVIANMINSILLQESLLEQIFKYHHDEK